MQHVFAPPATIGPDSTWWTLLSMGSTFRVGRHEVEVVTHHWTGAEEYRVDGELVDSTRNLGWHADRSVQVAGHEVRVQGRWYPVLPVRVSVDGQPRLDDLFPQLAWLKLGVGLPTALVSALFSVSILWDLWRLWGLWG